MGIFGAIGSVIFLFRRISNRCVSDFYKSKFKRCGDNVYIDRNCVFTPSTISIGNSVSIGPSCVIRSAHGYISIGNHVMIGPGVRIHGGNHERKNIGVWLDQETKEFGEDPDLVIEDDVWIGSNSIILKGVHVGRGAIIGAGSLVRNNVPPYSIVIGNPGKVVSFVFTPEEIIEHEKCLYSETERLPIALLEKNYSKYFVNRYKETASYLKI